MNTTASTFQNAGGAPTPTPAYPVQAPYNGALRAPNREQSLSLQRDQDTPTPGAQGPAAPRPVVVRGRVDPRPYHTRGDVETLDYLQAKLGDDGFESYLVGVIHTRLHRAMTLEGRDRRKDLISADFYFGRLVQHIAAVDGLGVDTPTTEGLPARLAQLTLAATNTTGGNDATQQQRAF